MNRVQLKLIEEIEENEDRLSDWERKFIDDLSNRDQECLTSGQNKMLNKIHRKVVFA